MRAERSLSRSSELHGGALFRQESFPFPVAWRLAGFERSNKFCGDRCDVVHGCFEQDFIGFGWLVEAADLTNKLQSGSSDFIVGDGRIEIE